MALINYNGEGGRIYFYPFCSNNFEDIAKECVGCQFAQEAGLAHVRNGSVQYPIFGQLCNPHVQVYPLPLYKCSVCSQSLLNAVLTYIIVVSLLTFSGNSWSILVWLREKKRPQIFFKLSLAISDFLFGTILLPSIAASLITTMYLPHEEYFAFSTYLDQGVDEYEYNWMALFSPFHNRFTALILYISQGASLSSVLLLNIDRHIAITYNIKYYQIMSKRKSLCIVISMWLVVASLALATTFTCGTFLTKPFALFLPVVEPESNKKELLKVLVIYLLPLSIIFFASCIIALCTSVKLYNLSKSNIVHRSAGFATTKAGIQRIRKFPFFQWYQKPYQIKKDNHSELQNETTQVACDCNTNCNLNFEQVDAKSESFLKNRNEDITRETCVPQEFELGPLAPNLLEEKKQQNGFDRKISQELVS